MVSKLFLLGRPGSGKSTVRRYLTKLAQHKLISPYPIPDYKILRSMAVTDGFSNQFRSADFGGFEVLDFSVFNAALQMIEHRVDKALKRHSLGLPKIAIIEFARHDYLQALAQFNPDFLKDAHFLVLESDFDICMNRIYKRIKDRKSDDDLFVPANFMEGYYQNDCRPDMVCEIQKTFGLIDQQLRLMRTECPRDEFLHECIKPYFESIIEPSFQARRFIKTASFSHSFSVNTTCNLCSSPQQVIPRSGELANEVSADPQQSQLVRR